MIRDVRLVYAPSDRIGNFGGDIDNYEWPRQTGAADAAASSSRSVR